MYAIFAFESDDPTAGAAELGIDVKCLPEMVYGSWTWHRTSRRAQTLKDGPKGVEEPAVRVDFLLVLLLDVSILRERGSDGDLSGILLDMSGDVSFKFSNFCLCDAFLIAANDSDNAESPRLSLYRH